MNGPMPNSYQNSEGSKRVDLASLLATAAEVEHCLLCQYLFAAFSMKRQVEEGGVTWMQLEKVRLWSATILMIARQEMEHLGIVNNLLTAIGEAPHFSRPNFSDFSLELPTSTPYTLQKFSPEFVIQSILFEMPDELSPANEAYLKTIIPNLDRYRRRTLQKLYDEILRLINQVDEKVLFVGPSGAQFTTPDVLPVRFVGATVPPRLYDVQLLRISNRESAVAAINQIVSEGEGLTADVTDCHFAKFLAMYKELIAEMETDPDFSPARDVIYDPKTSRQAGPVHDARLITDPATNRVSELFDLIYETMVLMLARFWSATDETVAQMLALERAIFFPLMTMGVRAAGEILTLLPAYCNGSLERAGPSFEIGREVALLPHRDAAWRVLLGQLEAATNRVTELSQDTVYPSPIRARLELMSQDFLRITNDFRSQIFDEKT